MPSQGNRIKRIYPADMLGIRDGSAPNKDARMTNCLVEINGKELEILDRPGHEQYANTSQTTPGLGAIVFSESDGSQSIFSVVGNKYYITRGALGYNWLTVGLITGKIGTGTQPMGVLSFGSKMWALNGYPTSGAVYQSSDGSNWQLATSIAGYNYSSQVKLNINAVVFNGAMWVIAGELSSFGDDTTVYSSSDGVTWSLTASSFGGTARRYCNLLSFSNKIWVLGGFAASGSVYFNDVHSSPDGVTWTQATAAAAWGARRDAAVFSDGTNMWIMGGRNASVAFNNIYSSTDGATWTLQGTAAWSARHSMGFCQRGNLYYIYGGFSFAGAVLTDVWISSDLINWTKAFTDTTPAGVATGNWLGGTSAILVIGNTMYKVTGVNGSPSANNLTIFKNQPQVPGSAQAIQSPNSEVTTSGASPPAGTAFNANGSLGPTTFIDFSQNLARTKIAMKNSYYAWSYDIATNTLTQVTDGDYPALTVRGLVYLDGTFYVMDTNGKIYGSDSETFTAWTSTNLINAQTEPDGGVFLGKYNQYVIAFGNYTTEPFFDAGNATGSPLSPVTNGTMLIGCGAADTVAQLEAQVYFVGQSKVQNQSAGRGFSVNVMQGMSYKPISTPDVERVLNNDGMAGAWGATVAMFGHSCYMLSLPATGVTLLYDIESGLWVYLTIRLAGTPQSITPASHLTADEAYPGSTEGIAYATLTAHGFSDGDPVTIAGATQGAYNKTANITYIDANTFSYPIASIPAAATGSPTATGTTESYYPLKVAFEYIGLQIFQHALTGVLYQIADTLYTDDSQYIDMKIRTARLDGGLSDRKSNLPKFMAWIDLITDRAASSMLMRYTDDDYQTYSDYRSVSLAGKRSRINRLGRFYRRGIELRYTDNTAMRVQALDLGLEDGEE